MATIVFDFDSTMVRCESLEEIVADQLQNDAERAATYRDVTAKGMSGGWSFQESLLARVSIAPPHRTDVLGFASRVSRFWTDGIADLLRDLAAQGHYLWIVSGAPLELLVPAGAQVGIPPERIRGVRFVWGPSGEFESVDPTDPFARSKTEGLADLVDTWQRPRIMIGDGKTDREVFEAGLVDFFIPFTAHVRRPEVLIDAMPEADSVQRLRELIEGYV